MESLPATLRQMSVLVTLLRRYLLPRHGNLLSFALWISVAGVALGVVQLMVVLSVMTGFIELFERNYTRISSEIIVVPRPDSTVAENIPASIIGTEGVAAISPAELAQGMIVRNGVGGVVIEGIDRQTTESVTPWKSIWLAPPRADLEAKNPYWIWMGTQLAKKLNVSVGDSVDMMVAEGKSRRIIPFVLSAIVKFGIYDHDLRYVRVSIDVLNEIFHRHHLEPLYKVKVKDGYSVDAVAESLRTQLGRRANVKKWSDVHHNVFLAVNHQKQLLFLILQIVVGLAAMNVVNLLMMSAHQRKRDTAILRAMGMRFSQVLQFFVLQGAAVGLVGVVSGLVLGLIACGLIEHFQPSLLSEAVYNSTRLPMRLRWSDVALIGGSGFALCLVFSFIPAIGAALSRPVGTLRYE
jgi:lipoprotein-releasing system permease protein